MQSYFLNPQSAAVGTTWTAIGDSTTRVNRVTVVNNTGTELEFRRAGSPATVHRLKDGQAYSYAIIFAANLEFRRVDTSNTQVTLYSVEAELN